MTQESHQGLSLTAQIILNAAIEADGEEGMHIPYEAIAAGVLRAAADQVVPWQPEPTEDSVGPTIDFGYAWALFSKANDVRQELISIADELKSHG
jgi:hypothetical protein